MSLTVQSPVSGLVVALDDVPDPVFAGKIVGPGVAVTPCLLYTSDAADE